MNERALRFDCKAVPLIGILHAPTGPAATRGVVMVVGGGPQFRVGGHRQLVLWARRLASEGYPVLRFDYRGMGDSHGDFSGFEDIDDDIRAAIDTLFSEVPGLTEVVLWGECDAAASILLHAFRDRRIKGLVLLNPWAHTEAERARSVLRHYYIQRILQPSFWRKLLRLEFNPLGALRSAVALIGTAATLRAEAPAPIDADAALPRAIALPERLLAGFRRFDGPIMLVMSGRDIIAREFDDLIASVPAWRQALAKKPLQRFDLKDADHTFSSREWRDQVADWGVSWLRSF